MLKICNAVASCAFLHGQDIGEGCKCYFIRPWVPKLGQSSNIGAIQVRACPRICFDWIALKAAHETECKGLAYVSFVATSNGKLNKDHRSRAMVVTQFSA